jgi:serine/threonine protein kinase/tetratricopeptide (TPR) repeat protein
MDLPPQIGRYQILERIAQGGMADVFLGRRFGAEGFEKRLVIKRIRPALARNPRLLALFVNEARLAVHLNHPNIVQVYELDHAGDEWFIAMEHIHGRDLTRIRRAFEAQGRRMPLPLAIYTVASALRGLGFAHNLADQDGHPLGIVHGDVSPHNVVVSFAGEVKVVDFGIARVAGKGAGEEQGRPGGGKFAYMSPEQVRGRKLDRRSDLYSAGVVLYELLVGHRLFSHSDPEEKLRMVREAIIPDPRPENAAITDDLWDILRSALTQERDERCATAEVFEAALREFLFRHQLQADGPMLAACMREIFAHERLEDPAVGDLSRLAEDLAVLERGGQTEVSEPPARADDAGEDAGEHPTATSPWRPGTTQELKTVVVVSVEVSGDTELVEALDPSLLVETQRERGQWFQQAARRHGGWLQPGQDDTVTVIFGVPRTREDDLDRALRFALEVRDGLGSARWRSGEASACVGIHEGQAAVQLSGDDAQVVGRGGTLKLARRLAGHGELGQILASQVVAERAEDSYVFAPGVPLTFRSHRERAEVPSYALEHRRAAIPASTAGRWLVRSTEIAVLRDSLVALGRREGRFVLLVGEAGVGKSRLVREVTDLARKRHLPVFSARAYPFHDAPLAALRDMVASIARIGPQDHADVIRTRLRQLKQLHLAGADIATLTWLFDLARSAQPEQPSRDQLQEVVRRLVRGLSEDGPVLVVFEDVQHMDTLERDLLMQMVRVTTDRPLLLLVTSTPERSAPLARAAAATIQLGPLDEDGLAQLVAELLHAREVDPDLARLIAADAAGNPKYIREMLKALERSGVLLREGTRVSLRAGTPRATIPNTLRGLFAARIDDLAPPVKAVLQVAATIGMRFPLRLLEECIGHGDVDAAASELLRRGMWREQDRVSEPSLEFASEPFWEVVGGSMLGDQLREAHRLVAEGMARLYEDDLDPHHEALARHLEIAGDLLEAARHLSSCGDLYRHGEFLDQALVRYEQALGLYAHHAQRAGPLRGDAAWTEISLHRRAGEVALLLGQLKRAERYLQVALDDASEHAFQHEEARTCLALGRVCMALPRRLEARAYLEQARDQADLLGDDDLALDSLDSLGRLALEEGDDTGAERLYRRTLERAGPTSRVAVRVCLGLATVMLRRDDQEAALGFLAQAQRMAEELNDRILQGRALNNLGIVHHARGDYEAALASFRRAIQVREGIGYVVGTIVNHHNVGDTLLHMGELGQAWDAFTESHRLATEADWGPGILMNSVYLGYLEAVQGASGGEQRLERALREARAARDWTLVANGLGLRARLALACGDRDASAAAFEEALAAADQAGDLGLRRELEAARRELLS